MFSTRDAAQHVVLKLTFPLIGRSLIRFNHLIYRCLTNNKENIRTLSFFAAFARGFEASSVFRLDVEGCGCEGSIR